MTLEYPAEEWLPLSGIQHFVFCRRQWALIHIEQQWQDNALTVDGRLMHRRVDDPFLVEKRKDLIVARSVPVASASLGLSGICDVVEFTASSEGVLLPGRDGRFLAVPVEYKRGREKRDPCDEAQLCAQAMCLEEMLGIWISTGFLYYGQTRRRLGVELTEGLRSLVHKASHEMHHYFQRGYTPRVKKSRACRSCSLVEVCLPTLQDNNVPASSYIRKQIDEA